MCGGARVKLLFLGNSDEVLAQGGNVKRGVGRASQVACVPKEKIFLNSRFFVVF